MGVEPGVGHAERLGAESLGENILVFLPVIESTVHLARHSDYRKLADWNQFRSPFMSSGTR